MRTKLWLALGLLLAGPLLAQSGTPAATLPTASERAKWWAEHAFGPGPLAGSAVGASLLMAFPPRAYPREWRQGAGGWGRNYGNYAAMNVTGYTVKYGVAELLGEDPRYRPSTETQVAKRIGHALGFAFVDRSRSGQLRPAVSTWAGALASGFVTKTYMPRGFNDSVHAGQWTLINFGAFVGNNLTEEFKPEFRRLAKKLHLPFSK